MNNGVKNKKSLKKIILIRILQKRRVKKCHINFKKYRSKRPYLDNQFLRVCNFFLSE